MGLVKGFAELFYRRAASQPDHPALIIDHTVYTYAEVVGRVMPIAGWLRQHQVQRLGIFASRSLDAYLGILAAHWVGAAYVPLNPKLPKQRLEKIIASAQPDAIVFDKTSLALVTNVEWECLVSLPMLASGESFIGSNGLEVSGQDSLQPSSQELPPAKIDPSALAYLLFTSGSTGEPKGIPVSFGNLGHLIENIHHRYQITAKDRIAQYCNISFDPSVLDMSTAWLFGATLYVVPEHMLLGPARFFQENNINVIFSIPSMISIMSKMNMLQPNSFPSLKHTTFGGEALTVLQAEAWRNAAPLGQIENFYGPTETTVVCLSHIVERPKNTLSDCEVVPIGKPWPGFDAAIVNHDHVFLAADQKGELAISGPQVVSGYWQDQELTRQKFIELTHPKLGKKIWYLTGDICYQDSNAVFHYIGRVDNQYKILGNRVEIEEIEFRLREITNCNEIGVVVHAQVGEVGEKIFAVIALPSTDNVKIMNYLKQNLPIYMLPDRIFHIDKLPLNENGKLDRMQLVAWVKGKLGNMNEFKKN